jgi:hypothetical protein
VHDPEISTRALTLLEARGDLGEKDLLLSIDEARRLLGYRPAMAGARPYP